ncbi:glycosyltransferase family 4 protein [Riemerella columbina]|uniref:glycosyltransferase family 4 protein n=1 Tax=Riemerella columbina TaxID=103810 RepID=UPI00266F3B4F|nr:glycosyltransferase family 4 protein [Riemerella columbina]WKS94933.1 glycosyltransferase family 4 protein [Riemerella columbina]
MRKLIRITTVPTSLKILLRGQHMFMTKNRFEVVGVSSPGIDLEEVSNSENIRIYSIDMSRQITPFKDLKSLWKMWKLLNKEKPQIVHTHTPKAGLIGMLASFFAGVPIRLHTVAGLPLMESQGLKRKILDIVEKLTYACATKVYPNSRGLYNFIIEKGYIFDHNKIKVIANGSSNGINTDDFSVAQISENQREKLKSELGIKPDDFVYIFVGRLVGDKGINELVEAFKNLQLPNAKLLLVGPEERALDPLENKTIQEIEQNPHIITVGFQSDVRPYFAVADALVFPSYREGFPNVVMQAGAMELPSIVSDINGCNEIIVPQQNGIIVPPKDVQALQSAMKELLANNRLYQQLKSQSRPMIVQRYQQQVVWEALLKEYQDLLNEKC